MNIKFDSVTQEAVLQCARQYIDPDRPGRRNIAEATSYFVKNVLCGHVIRKIAPFMTEQRLTELSWEGDDLLRFYVSWLKAERSEPGYSFLFDGKKINGVETPDGIL